jgi:hypothetical protein
MSEVHAAINAVMKEVGYVQKLGRVTGSGPNYSYAGEKDLIQAIRPVMVEHGLMMYVSNIINVTRDTYSTKNGNVMNTTVITCEITFSHISGDSVKSFAIGEGADSGDKSANKAMTGAYKYALRQTFCIETGDDPDKQPSVEQEKQTQDLAWALKYKTPSGHELGPKSIDELIKMRDWYKENKQQMKPELQKAFDMVMTEKEKK